MRNIKNIYGLSPIQLSILFENIFEDQTSDHRYFVQAVYKITGRLNCLQWKKAWELVIHRNECLRASFLWKKLNEPIQIIHKQVDLIWKEDVWENIHDVSQRLEDLTKNERKSGFDLTKPPLMRFGLVKISGEIHYFILNIHHLIIDGWSLAIIFDEVNQIYNSLINKHEVVLQNRPSYLSYLSWLKSCDVDGAKNYWRKELEGVSQTKISSLANDVDGEYILNLNKANSKKVKDIAIALSVTVSTVINAIWAIVLSKFTIQQEVVFGMTISGRQIDLVDVENIIGIFINTVPLRVSVNPSLSFVKFVANIKQSMLSAQTYGYISLASIQAETSFKQEALFDSILVFENYPVNNKPNNDLSIQGISSYETNGYALTVTVIPKDELEFRFNYKGKAISNSEVKLIANSIDELISNMDDDLDMFVGNFSILSSKGLEQIEGFNQTLKEYDFDKTLYDLFKEKVLEFNDRIAFVYENRHVSYGCLANTSSNLVSYIRSNFSVSSGSVIAIILPRNLEFITSMLVVMKLGCTILAIAPETPIERIKYQINNSNAVLILADKTCVPKLKLNVMRCDISKVLTEQELEQELMLNGELTPNSISYIVYTSGSTGMPKGVALSHKNFVNLITWLTKEISFVSQDVASQKTSQASIDFIWEVWWPLISGIKSIIISKDNLIDFSILTKICVKQYINNFIGIPSFFELILDSGYNFKFSRIILTAEKASLYLLSELQNCLSSRVLDFYGPSETTADPLFFDYTDDCYTEENKDISIIGSPIANTQVYILDINMNILPIGVMGEIYIGGVGIASCYVNNPELTAQKFLADPFHSRKETTFGNSTRLYKTGDLGRYLPNGNVEFIGRRDDQVKIRGYKVEYDEIENILEDYDKVKEAAVVYKDSKLIAYIIPRKTSISNNEIDKYLEKHLPDYMCPTHYVQLEKFPLTLSGKVNKQALPKVIATNITKQYQAPRDKLDAELCQIWQDVLGVEKVGIDDSFFKLGGHSLLAIKLISRINKKYDKGTKISSLFKKPTIRKFKEDILEQNNNCHKINIPHLEPRPVKASLSFAQQGLWFLDKLLPNVAIYNMPIALELEGKLSKKSLKDSFVMLVQRHEILRTVFKENNIGEPYQEVLVNVDLYKEVDLSNQQNQEIVVKQYKCQEANWKFDLSKGPLCRITLLILSKNRHLLLITMHHIISDDWSVDIFFEELNQIYTSHSTNSAVFLPKLQLQYIDYCIWQRNWLTGERLEKQLGYWKNKLENLPMMSTIPGDKPRPKFLNYEGKHLVVGLKKLLSKEIFKICSDNSISLHMFLLGCLQVLICKLSGNNDVVVGSPFSNRNCVELEDVIGLFVNSLISRNEIVGGKKFSELISEIRDNNLEAHNFQDLPFEQLVDNLNIERLANANPIFQVRVVTMAEPDKKIKLGDIETTFMAPSIEQSKFDLLFRFFVHSDKTIYLRLEYLKDLYTAQRIKYVVKCFRQVLKQVVYDFDILIRNINVVKVDEIFGSFVKTTYAELPEKFVHRLFEKISLQTPDVIAVIYNGIYISYGELNRRANVLANYLSQSKCGVIAIEMDRSLDFVIAILGALKAGCSFVPIDSQLPETRKKYIIADSKANILLKTIKVDYSENTNFTNVGSNRLAYIIYTSGTTGVPKGALIQHHGIINYSNYIAEEVFGKGGMHIAYMNATHTDLGYNVLFPALLGGKTLHIVEKEGELDIEKLLQQFDREQIDVVKMTPSYYGMLEAEIEGREDVRLQNLMRRMHFIIGGEALPSKLLREDRRITNHYGPTETTIGITINKVNRESEHGHIVALGKTITGSKIYVLDEDMNLMPIGAKGELYMSGPGIAIGYVGSPELTAEKFIANPFRSKQEILAGINSRFYRSGDIGRYLADGRVEFIGRKDDQVKIRGYRIELGEIEGVLKSHSNIKGAVVKAIDGKLIAYIVPMKVASSNAELNDYLNKYLPVYMLPSHYIVLDKLPLAKTGKVNRKALPTPDLETEDSKVNYYEPQNQLEQELCQIWQDVLGLERVGVTDNFFKLGGHSLLAIKLISRLRRKYGKEIKLISLFDKPTVKEFKEEIEKSGIEEERIVIPHLEPRPVRAELSFAQQRLWFLDKLMPDKVVYNMPIALEFKGLLDRIALKNVFKEISQRHEILRTVFKETEDGQAYQEILKRVELYEEIDLSSQENQIDIVEQYKVREANWKFDLSQGPLCRVKLLILNKEHHVLLITIHHIISDGWSINVLFEEVKQIYSYCITGSKEKLVSLSLQYVDYSVWQRDWFTGERLTEQLNYWQKKLQGATGELNLPTDRPRPKELTYEGGYHIFELGQELGVKVQAICEQQGVSLHMFLLAALNVLLYKLSGNDDIVVGVPTSGRHIPGTENLIGFFVNTLVMRSSVSGSKTFLQLLQEVRTDCLQSYQYQDMPFEKLVDFLEIERATNKNPIFQVFFDVKNYSKVVNEFSDNLKIKNITNEYAISKFDLEVACYKNQRNVITVKMLYQLSLYDKDTIQRMGGYYKNIIEFVAKSLKEKIRNIKFLPKEEVNYQLIKLNDTNLLMDEQCVIHGLFEKQVGRTPDSIVVIYENLYLSYKELNDRANRLAYYLKIVYGVKENDLVSLCLDRSEHMLIGILAILKSSCCYVPIASDYPDERKSYIIKDAACQLVLSSDICAKELKSLLDDTKQILSIDNERFLEKLSEYSDDNPEGLVNNNDLAYVMYTSGTTGNPKGAGITHSGLENRIKWMNEQYPLRSNDKILQKTPYTFDVSVWELLWSICYGACTVFAKPGGHRDSDYIKDISRKEQITIMHFVPSMLIAYVGVLDRSYKHNLRYLFCSGEELKPSVLKESYKKLGEVEIHNLYGPTEASIDVLHYGCVDRDTSNVYIGKPISNIQTYILSDDINLLPIGSVGEIYIGGIGLARGYINRPGLTAEKFIANPFATEEDIKRGCSRLYRTGDLGRYLPDGNIEYIGRNDEQVKIRGFRIELGEIESVLQSYDGISQSVVVTKSRESGDKYLVGYYVAEKKLDKNNILSYLHNKLPEYMVPSILVYLDKIPLMVSGKVDKKALPEPFFKSDQAYQAPQDQLEKELCKIWQEILGLTQIGVNDNFFKLGGHSLLAIKLISRLRKKYGKEIKLISVFDKPTIREFKEEINESNQLRDTIVIPRLSMSPRKAELSFAQQRLWFLDKLLPDAVVYNMPIALELRGKLDERALKATFEKIIQRHEVLRTIFKETDNGEVYQEVLNRVEAYEEINLMNKPTNIVEEYKLQEATWKFDLSRSPLCKIKLLILNDEHYLLLITMHHIISDGWSLNVFFEEMGVIYRNYISKSEVSLSELPVQYIDYSVWQRNWLVGDKLTEQLNYWQEKLHEVPEDIGLPTDKPRPQQLSYKGEHHYFELDEKVFSQVQSICIREGVSAYMFLLAALDVLLYKLSGNDDIVVGSPTAGRHIEGTERLIGFFVNTLVMRSKVTGRKTFKQLLLEVRTDTLQSYQYQDIPFEKLVDSLGIERVANKNPLFQVRFVVIEDDDIKINLGSDLSASFIPTPVEQSKFDLLFRFFILEKRKLVVRIEYLSDLYNLETIKRFDRYFRSIISLIVANLDIKIRDIDILDVSEKEFQLVELNNNTGMLL